MKMVVLDHDDQVIVRKQVETPWVHGPAGTAWLESESFSAALRQLVIMTSEAAKDRGISHITALGVAGMGETGMIVDPTGAPVGPAMAWFDPRGGDQVNAFSDTISNEFAGRTGLPLGAQVSVAKIAFLRDQGVSLAKNQWLNLPEFVVTLLGGDRGLE
jgi:sugar (pentulose or hexulose) kinase